jgi:hypothetical protein
MNVQCKEYQRQITLLLYEELPEGAHPQLQAHLRECADCRDAFDAEKAMHTLFASDAAGWDVPPDLLIESRSALANDLDRVERKRSWWRVPAFSVVFTPMRLLESAALIAMGLALGVYVSNQQAQNPSTVASNPPSQSQPSQNQLSGIPSNGTISNLQVVNVDPSSGQVELAGEISQPLRIGGRLDDADIRQLLFNALRDPANPGSRLKAVEVLSQKPTDESVEEVLISALVYDDDPGVRMRALEGLKKFANEQHVRAAFMHTLQNDENAGIRIEAINALTARNARDREFAEKLREATKSDDNPYIRNKVLQLVGTAK